MFLKLLASFLFVIFIFSLFSLVNNGVYLDNIEDNLFKLSEQGFLYNINETETYFNNINANVVSQFFQANKNIGSTKISMFKMYKLKQDLNNYMLFDDSIEKIVLYIDDFDYVITNGESSNKDIYFETFFYNEKYTNEFWDTLFNEDFSNRVLPAEQFNDFGHMQYVIPYVCKRYYNADYLMIIFLDAQKLVNSYGLNSYELFYILDDNNNIILSSEFSQNPSMDASPENEYEIVSSSTINNMKYALNIKDGLFSKVLMKNNSRFTLLIIFASLLCVLISIILAKYFNNPIKQISSVIDNEDFSCGTNIIEIANTVGVISQKNLEYQKDLKIKNSILQDIFLQAELHNLLITCSNVENEFSKTLFRFSKYMIIYFKIHKKNINFNLDTNKMIIAIKELIGNYVSNQFSENFTFIINKNSVVSVVNLPDRKTNPENKIKRIVNKLTLESELIYFTVVYSEICSDISQINSVYEKLIKSLKYRILNTETQLINSADNSNIPEKYIFPYDAQGKIKNHIKNLKVDECINLANSIIDVNIENHARSYTIQLLCIDIFIICKHCIDETCNAVPADFNTRKYYDILQDCTYEDQYKSTISDILTQSVSYINSYKSDNYIVNYVKTYINENYKNDISYDIIAENLHITRPYLTTYFKSKTGINPSEYLNRLRINKSIHLLNNTSLKVKDVSKSIGIPNVSTFIRMFKKHMGMTPVEFKRMGH